MKKFYSILSVALAFSMLAFTSCSDDDGDDVNRTEALTSKKWTVTKIEVGSGDDYEDVTEAMQSYECEKDDYETYGKDFVYTHAPGTDDCDGDAAEYKGTWAFKDGEKILAVTTGGDVDEYTIASISATQLKLKYEDKDNSITVGDKTYYMTTITTYTGK